MKPKDFELAANLRHGLVEFSRNKLPLLGIQSDLALNALIEQLIESIHRIKYISLLLNRETSPLRADPNSRLFDPERAAIFEISQGRIDEAFWFVFMAVFFGKNRRGGWRYASDVYGALGSGRPWNWARISGDPSKFKPWLSRNLHIIKRPGVAGGFGNHRKYTSLNAVPGAFESYVDWVGPHRSHQRMILDAINVVGNDRRKLFDYLYRSINVVETFGRTAKFDFLTMIGKLNLAPIEPGSTYMHGATGPLDGARLLFEGSKSSNISRAECDKRLVVLDETLNVGMQVLEDSLCNWQKNPTLFVPFRG